MKTKRFLLIIMIAVLCLSLNSCLLAPLGSLNGGGEDYLTREEAEQLIKDSMGSDVVVEGGDNYEINIDNATSTNLLAASVGLLGSVSVHCTFEENYQSGFGSGAGVSTQKTSSAGSGVIYKLDEKNPGTAYIITNYHVVYNYRANTKNRISNDIKIYLYGQELEDYGISATYVGGSMQYDLAVLKVENSRILAESSATAVRFADSDKVSVLETAIAIGNPEAAGISATVGYVNVESEYLSMIGSDNTTRIQLRVMRIDAAVNSGNSGGGLFNDKGELIGIVNAKMSSTSIDNIGYAIPSNVVKYITENILYYCDGADKDCENVYRCIVGITVTAATSRAVYDTESGKIYKVEDVKIDSLTETSICKGLLEAGDIIKSITIDGVKYEVTRMHHVVDSMLNARADSTVTMEIERAGESLTVTVPITEECLTVYS